jgi:type I restriction enzyme R subunit
MAIAWDISTHWRDHWQGTGFKAQLVAPWKHIALLYKKYLEEFGMVSSEVLISAPDDREGEMDIHEENVEPVNRFWKGVLEKYGSEEEYNRSLISRFKNDDEPEIIIVCHKLLTGFDAPRNTVMYLDRDLKEHTLLQAIARVNRIYDGKDFGYIIDYRGVLSNLGRALSLYATLPDFDSEDLEGTLTDTGEVVARLPQQHSDLWDVFKTIENKYDEEAYEQLLADEALRARFYDRLRAYSKTLTIALASVSFIEHTQEERIRKYKRDLKFFQALRTRVSQRYGETVDFSAYEPKIEKLIDRHVGAGEVERVTDLVNIFEKERFEAELARVEGEAAQADTIAHRTKRAISEHMEEDPAFYKKFSEMLEEIIQAFRQRRIEASEYLRKAREVMESVVNRTGDELPSKLADAEVAKAFYGVIRPVLEGSAGPESEDLSADAALAIDGIIRELRIVSWTNNVDRQNEMRTRIEDYLFELKDERGLALDFEGVDEIMEECLKIARLRYA